MRSYEQIARSELWRSSQLADRDERDNRVHERNRNIIEKKKK